MHVVELYDKSKKQHACNGVNIFTYFIICNGYISKDDKVVVKFLTYCNYALFTL